MNQNLKPSNTAAKWLVFPFILFVLTVALQMRGTYEPINKWLLDFRMERVSVPSSGEIAIVAIDSASLQDVGTWPWSRSIHADVLNRLVALDAGVVLFDVDFAFPLDAAGDENFAAALEQAGGATLLATFMQYGLEGEIVFNQPHEPFYQRSWPAAVVLAPSASGQIRDYPTGTTIDGLFVPSAGVQIAGSYASEASNFVINFGISPQSIPVFSVSDLLNGKLSKDDIAGRSILIGAMAAELGDNFAVPLHQVVPGVMVHALAAETLLQDAVIARVPSIWLLPPLFLALCALHVLGRSNAWRLVSLAFLTSCGVELAATLVFWLSYSNFATAMFHPAVVMLAIGRLARRVDLSRILIKRQEVQMENSERLRRHIFENSSDGFLAINSRGKVVFQSDVAQSLLENDAIPKNITDAAVWIMQQEEPKPLLDRLELNTTTETKSLEMLVNASELNSLDDNLKLSSEPLALITLRDVTELKRKQRQIEFLSLHDERTSALRRHSFCDRIEARILSEDRFAVAAISLRRLTAINAMLGRDVGDKIIAEAVSRLMNSSMALGEVARLDGNVLGVVIPDLQADTSPEAMCLRIQEVLTRPYQISGSQIQIGLSIGHVVVERACEWCGEDCLSRAQDALAHARGFAGNTCSSYNNADSEQRERRRRLEHGMNRALEREEFHLLYQPQYRLSDQSLIGAEALIRWESAEFGFVSPAEFIPIAESSGFILELGEFVLKRSIESAVVLPEQLAMSPNVSVFQLLVSDFPKQVASLLGQHDLAPERLCLELTESEFLSPESEAVERMHMLKSIGVTWALDDFGTGYSSLSYLKDLPFDKIKLDRAFLKDVLKDQKAQTALESLVRLVQGYGKTLLCEGVETQAEADLLSLLGCDSVQGYYFGRPEPFDELNNRALVEIGSDIPETRAALHG